LYAYFADIGHIGKQSASVAVENGRGGSEGANGGDDERGWEEFGAAQDSAQTNTGERDGVITLSSCSLALMLRMRVG
jgi:hypothetical protein